MRERGEACPACRLFPSLTSPFLQQLGITSENVAEKYGIDRATQDGLAVRSHARAAAARSSGRFKDEIVPVETMIKDPKTGEEKRIVVSEDDGIRPGVTAAALAELRTVFKKNGTTTAGNSSQVNKERGRGWVGCASARLTSLLFLVF